MTPPAMLSKPPLRNDAIELERRLAHLSKDPVIDALDTKSGPAYKLGEFKGFVGQEDRERREAFAHRAWRSRIS